MARSGATSTASPCWTSQATIIRHVRAILNAGAYQYDIGGTVTCNTFDDCNRSCSVVTPCYVAVLVGGCFAFLGSVSLLYTSSCAATDGE
ncbi:hypothetical protein K461DRAFT_281037 [Myriangium duriaei CBS 260.36]|uniref:Uncharacterized protein n=1 Tax=Myriangium duriaei CBS 260.36 TaxID=1168546 RepID=A0A9P4IUC4_9PEZI|nr:hypothetical protein K461DRAFT_281037 [Myriangium duriaei CBS 260.36]